MAERIRFERRPLVIQSSRKLYLFVASDNRAINFLDYKKEETEVLPETYTSP